MTTSGAPKLTSLRERYLDRDWQQFRAPFTRERLAGVDWLRGVALASLIAATLILMGRPLAVYGGLGETVNRTLLTVLLELVALKPVALLGFLLGWGAACQLKPGDPPAALAIHFRRAATMAFIGLGLSLLVWHGDLLLAGGLVLFLATPLLKLSGRKGISALLLGVVIFMLVGMLTPHIDETVVQVALPDPSAGQGGLREPAFGTGTFWQVAADRLRILDDTNILRADSLAAALSALLSGALMVRAGGSSWFAHETNQSRRLALALISIGGLLTVARLSPLVPSVPIPLAVTQGIDALGAGPGDTAFVIGLALLLSPRLNQAERRETPLLRVLGRMALTNYAVALSLLSLYFYGYGLGGYRRVSLLGSLVVASLIMYLSAIASRWWLGRHELGPLEYLTRVISYGWRPMVVVPRSGIKRRVLNTVDRISAWTERRWLPVAAGGWALVLVWAAGLAMVQSRVTHIETSLGGFARMEELTAAHDQPEPEQEGLSAEEEIRNALSGYPPSGRSATVIDPGNLGASVTPESLLSQVRELSSDHYLGRLTGSEGGHRAAAYIADSLSRYGFQPGGSNGTYFQSFPVNPVVELQAPSLMLEPLEGNPSRIRAFEGFSPILGGYLGPGTASGSVVWASDCSQSDLLGAPVQGAILLCRSLDDPLAPLLARSAGILVMEGRDGLHAGQKIAGMESIVPVPLPALVIDDQTAAALLTGSDMTLAELLITYEPSVLPVEVHIDVAAGQPAGCGSTGCVARNVVGVLPGRDSEYREQAVLLVASYDGSGIDPGGQVWPGANYGASGLSVLLEVARILQERDLAFRRTVIVAALDGSQLDHAGARVLGDLDVLSSANVVSTLYLGAVGGPANQVQLTGDRQLISRLRTLSSQLDLEHAGEPGDGAALELLARIGPPARIDVGIFATTPSLRYTLADAVSTLSTENLVRAGQLTMLHLTTAAELEPAIDSLLRDRTQALRDRDRQALLASTHPQARAWLSNWFDGLIRTEPRSLELRLESLVPVDSGVAAQVWQSYEVQLENGVLVKSAGTTTINFSADGDSWLWRGPDFESLEPDPRSWSYGAIGYSSEVEPDDVQRAAAVFDDELSTALTVLGLSLDRQLELVFFESEDELRMTMDPSLPRRAIAAHAPGRLGLVMPDDGEPTDEHLAGLFRALLYEVGIDRKRPNWVWEGLPAVLLGRTRPLQVQSQYLSTVVQSQEAEEVDPQAAAWARAEYLRRSLGWRSLGSWLMRYGDLCRQSDGCTDQAALEPALQMQLGLSLSEFEQAWKTYWGDQYEEAAAALDRLLVNRQTAVLERNEIAFAAGVSRTIPGLLQEQHNWFQAITSHEIGAFRLEGKPLALLPDGGAISQVAVEYTLTEISGPAGRVSSTMEVRLAPTRGGLAWAGQPFERTSPGRIEILFPAGEHHAAQELLKMLSEHYPQLMDELDLAFQPLVVKLYPDSRSLLRHTAAGVANSGLLPYAVARGEPFHVVLDESTQQGEFTGLLPGLARYALAQSGIEEEWVLSALALNAADSIDHQGRAIANARHQLGLQNWIESGLPHTLDSLPAPEGFDSVSREEALALDTFRFLERRYGQQAVERLLTRLRSGSPLDSAVQSATGLSLEHFTAAWSQSFMAGHLDQAAIELAEHLQGSQIAERMRPFVDPSLKGRRGGTSGAYETAEFIGQAFAELGLEPLPQAHAENDEQPVPENRAAAMVVEGSAADYWRPYSIPFQSTASAPRLVLQAEASGWPVQLTYREDFLLLSDPPPSGGYVQDRILYVRDLEIENLDPSGWIVLLKPRGNPIEAARRAFEMGAVGVLLEGQANSDTALFGRQLSAPASDPLPGPVLTLTYQGFRRVLAAAGLTTGTLSDAPAVFSIGLTAGMSTYVTPVQERVSGNMIGVLPGSSPELRDEIIIIGAHYDHVGNDPPAVVCDYGPDGLSYACGSEPGLRYSGANDNATGLAVLLELARVWGEAGYRPGRTIVFAAWGDGELDQLGLQHFMDNSPYPQGSMYGLLELDKLGAGAGFYVEARAEWETEGHMISALLGAERILHGRLEVSDGSGTGEHARLSELAIPSVILSRLDTEMVDLPDFLADPVEDDWLQSAARLAALSVMTLAE